MGQGFQPEAGDIRKHRVHPNMSDSARFDVASAQQRTVTLLFIFGGEVEPLSQIQHSPLSLRAGGLLLPGSHALGQIGRIAHCLVLE